MTNPFDQENGEYLVLVNDEKQYSLWPAFLTTPEGWTEVGPKGGKAVCLAWIDEQWTDMRPMSLLNKGTD